MDENEIIDDVQSMPQPSPNTPGEVPALYLPFLTNIAGWATFKAIIEIIVGALSCLGIITAAYGIPKIMAGIKLLSAAENMKKYTLMHDSNILDSLYNFNKYFKYSGISIIIQISFIVLLIIFYIVLIAFIFSNLPDFIDKFRSNGRFF